MRSIRLTALISAAGFAIASAVVIATPASALTTRPIATAYAGCSVSPVKGVKFVRCPLVQN